MKKTYLLLGTLLGLLILFSTSCQDTNNERMGTLVIKLTDAPFPIDTIEAATVNITKIEIRKVSEGDEEGYPFITLSEEDMDFNLLDLRNGITADLVEMKIEAGNYDLIRLYVDEASIAVKDHDDPYKLKVPSGSQTGIKIFMEPDLRVEGGLSTELLLDFNVEKSFLLQGNMNSPAGIKGFHFKPVIRAVNNSTAGSVEGVVIDADSEPLQNVSVWLEHETENISSVTDETGYYSMIGIPAGLYDLSAALEGMATLTFEGIEIVAGNLTVQNFTLTPAEDTEEEE